MSIIALIPARSGSKRIPNKNIKRLGNHPLLAYTIEVARQSGIFDGIYCSTDSEKIAQIAKYYGAYPVMRPPELAKDDSPDIEWIHHTLFSVADQWLSSLEENFDYFAILRPTNPFRTPEMIQKAWKGYLTYLPDSLRGVELVEQHPYKMWQLYQWKSHNCLFPLVELFDDLISGRQFDLPTQVLDKYYVQNGSIQISKSELIREGVVTGRSVIPYVTQGFEGYDLNTEKDWVYAEWLIEHNKVKLIGIDKEPYGGELC